MGRKVNPFADKDKERRCAMCVYLGVALLSKKISTKMCAIASACRRISSTS